MGFEMLLAAPRLVHLVSPFHREDENVRRRVAPRARRMRSRCERFRV